MEGCIFCEIIKGNIASYKLYEDDKIMAFLDHRPVREGHTMVIPKTHVDRFTDLNDAIAAHIVVTGNIIGRRIQEALKPKRVGFAIAGFGVPHAHYHVIPMWDEFDITSSQYAAIKDGNINFTIDHIPAADNNRQTILVDLLRI